MLVGRVMSLRLRRAPAKGEFTIDSPGSFEVESHHLEKMIVILNAR
jgi:hypothetical protein